MAVITDCSFCAGLEDASFHAGHVGKFDTVVYGDCFKYGREAIFVFSLKIVDCFYGGVCRSVRHEYNDFLPCHALCQDKKAVFYALCGIDRIHLPEAVFKAFLCFFGFFSVDRLSAFLAQIRGLRGHFLCSFRYGR